MKLSLTALFLQDAYNIPQPLAKLIGMFAGTDMFLLPGDKFTKVIKIHNLIVRWLENSLGTYGWVSIGGIKIMNYEVNRVTPCFAYVRQLKVVWCFYELEAKIQYGGSCFKTVWSVDPTKSHTCWLKHTFRTGVAFCQNDIVPEELAQAVRTAKIVTCLHDVRFDRLRRKLLVV